MAGMAANISAFNTVFSYDLWGDYIVKDREDGYYLMVGRIATVGATFIAIFTASIAGNFSNMMEYLQTLFGFFNAPLFATFILGMFWKRMTPRQAGSAWWLVRRRPSRCGQRMKGTARPSGSGCGVPVGLDRLRRRRGAEHHRVDGDHTEARLRAGRTGYSETPVDQRTDPKEASYPWYRRTVPLASLALAMVIV